MNISECIIVFKIPLMFNKKYRTNINMWIPLEFLAKSYRIEDVERQCFIYMYDWLLLLTLLMMLSRTFNLSLSLSPLLPPPYSLTPLPVIIVEFVTRDVVVNEDNGTVFVCMNRSSLTERPLTIPIAITKETADRKLR